MFRSSNSKVKVKVLNSQQKSDLFHFKVIQLRVHEDTRGSSSCKVRFHFFFELLRKRVKNELEIFDWNVNHAPKQRLYLSRDTMRLMEVINGTTAVVYQREDVIDGETQAMESEKYQDGNEIDYGQQVKWKVLYRIKKFPKSLTEHTSVPYLFSPNFTYQFDFDYRARQFMIKET